VILWYNSAMEIEINRIALYLAGRLPPYYKPYHKFAFVELLEGESDGSFTESVFGRIQKYVTTDEAFYAECLLRLQKHDDTVFLAFLDKLWVPDDARGRMMSSVDKKGAAGVAKKVYPRTIGFITPFDKRRDNVKKVIQEVLWGEGAVGWEVVEFEIDDDSSNILWPSVEQFLRRHSLYIVDLRKKLWSDQTNINVALELGYILAREKECIVITDSQLPSDIHGFKYIKPGTATYTAWDDSFSTEQLDADFKKNLEGAILSKIRVIENGGI